MALDLLDTPVRLTWDLCGSSGCPERAAVLSLADRLVDGGVFFVTLDGRPLLHPAAGELLERLQGGGCQVQVYCTGAPLELTLLETHGRFLAGVLIDVDPFMDAGQLATERLRGAVAAVGATGCEAGPGVDPPEEKSSIYSSASGLCPGARGWPN